MKTATTLLTAFVLLGCSSMPAPAVAQDVVPTSETRVIQVDATATVRRAPDRAVIQIAVETPAPTAQEASQQNAEVMERVIAALRQLGIDDDDMRTSRISLNPRYDHRPQQPREPEIIGYTASNQVMVTTDSVPLVGRLVDAAVAAGANRVTGIHFELRDPEAAHQEALRLAIEKARREAEVVASALGERLGPALRVSTSAAQPAYRATGYAMDMARAEAMPAPAPTPVEPGELDVHANVSITFSIGT